MISATKSQSTHVIDSIRLPWDSTAVQLESTPNPFGDTIDIVDPSMVRRISDNTNLGHVDLSNTSGNKAITRSHVVQSKENIKNLSEKNNGKSEKNKILLKNIQSRENGHNKELKPIVTASDLNNPGGQSKHSNNRTENLGVKLINVTPSISKSESEIQVPRNENNERIQSQWNFNSQGTNGGNFQGMNSELHLKPSLTKNVPFHFGSDRSMNLNMPTGSGIDIGTKLNSLAGINPFLNNNLNMAHPLMHDLATKDIFGETQNNNGNIFNSKWNMQMNDNMFDGAKITTKGSSGFNTLQNTWRNDQPNSRNFHSSWHKSWWTTS